MGVWEGGSSGPPLGVFVFLFLISFVPIFAGVSLYSKFFAKKWKFKKKVIFSAALSVLSIIIFLAYQFYSMKDIVY